MKINRMVVVALAVGALACGGDDGITTPNPTPGAESPNIGGRWSSSQMWLTQFYRTRDGYNGSWTCSGNLTITQSPGARTFTGFAVVGAPCPATSFDLSGTIEANGGMTMAMSGPRPGAGTCPQPPVASYVGTYDGRIISVRSQVQLNCPGELEGPHTFNQIVTANRN